MNQQLETLEMMVTSQETVSALATQIKGDIGLGLCTVRFAVSAVIMTIKVNLIESYKQANSMDNN
jgi:hypothetical protein